jgi:2-keto-4-pentenoate hydratase
MTAQFALRRARIAAGDKPLGWKVGFGAPAAMEKFDISGPLIGFLLQSGFVPSGGSVSLKGWNKPVAEPEIAIRMGRDLEPGTGREAAAAAIASLSPAIELADVDLPPENPEAILAHNIFQRRVVLDATGNNRPGASVSGLSGSVFRRGKQTAQTNDPEALTGELVGIVRHVADLLGAFGERLAAGDIIIAGSVVPPLIIEPGETDIRFDLEPIGKVSVNFSYA